MFLTLLGLVSFCMERHRERAQQRCSVVLIEKTEEKTKNATLTDQFIAAGDCQEETLREAEIPIKNESESERRRRSWEMGEIDYLGVDSFDNILMKLNQSMDCIPTHFTKERN
ncbi:uncharacterized protein LOC134238039 [Saccostrea cucullata]|uniref:uncharacterized protein LOC134238039 n=1 Tax=Saccostrea cuccullata TaxID=36930 RepID=UPI002ED285DB